MGLKGLIGQLSLSIFHNFLNVLTLNLIYLFTVYMMVCLYGQP